MHASQIQGCVVEQRVEKLGVRQPLQLQWRWCAYISDVVKPHISISPNSLNCQCCITSIVRVNVIHLYQTALFLILNTKNTIRGMQKRASFNKNICTLDLSPFVSGFMT